MRTGKYLKKVLVLTEYNSSVKKCITVNSDGGMTSFHDHVDPEWLGHCEDFSKSCV